MIGGDIIEKKHTIAGKDTNNSWVCIFNRVLFGDYVTNCY